MVETRQDGSDKKEQMDQTVRIRGIQTRDLNDIFRWRKKKVNLKELEGYYRNKKSDNTGNPYDIVSIVTVNFFNKPTGVLTIRWRDQQGIPLPSRIALVENVDVDPQLKDMDIHRELTIASLEIGFDRYRGYRGQGAKEIRWQTPIQEVEQYGFEKSIRGGWCRLSKEKWQMLKQKKPEFFKHPPVDFVNLRL